jgi:hypothetical protein
MEQFITILLAWRMAKVYGENESEAIRLCSSKVFRTVNNLKIRKLIVKLANPKTESLNRIAVLKRMETAMRIEQIL